MYSTMHRNKSPHNVRRNKSASGTKNNNLKRQQNEKSTRCPIYIRTNAWHPLIRPSKPPSKVSLKPVLLLRVLIQSSMKTRTQTATKRAVWMTNSMMNLIKQLKRSWTRSYKIRAIYDQLYCIIRIRLHMTSSRLRIPPIYHKGYLYQWFSYLAVAYRNSTVHGSRL